ncbi:MAG: 3-dehydroquinate synthase [Opitutales bacterium]
MGATLTVRLRERSYPIHFVRGAERRLRTAVRALAAEGRRSVLLTDAGVARAQRVLLGRAFAGVPRLVLPAGEQSKSPAGYFRILNFLAEQELDRRAVLWVVGGGVMGDLGGFAAASYLRGIDFFQVPTTLLAMVDSSIGGKTGLNLPAGKNLVGAFHHPRAVYIFPELLRTLPAREFAAGMAEVLKYGLLGDRALFARLVRAPLRPRSPRLAAVVRRCCALKAAVVAADERETAAEGGRALLNLGHTFGHAIERVGGYGTYLHGEAVAIGLAGAARLSRKLGHLDAAAVAQIERTVAAHDLPVRLRRPLRVPALLAAMRHDKKARAGGLRFVVLPRLGRAATRSGIDPAAVAEVWGELGARV